MAEKLAGKKWSSLSLCGDPKKHSTWFDVAISKANCSRQSVTRRMICPNSAGQSSKR